MNIIKNLIKKTLLLVLGGERIVKLSSELSERLNSNTVQLWAITLLKRKGRSMDPKASLEMLMKFDNDLYQLLGQESIRYDGGVHTKHRHIRYHDFFTNNIPKGYTVLDIGSSTGELVSDIAKKVAPGKVVGIEIEAEKVAVAKRKYNDIKNLRFITGDATKYEFAEKFDVITLSNVLEHIEKRVKLLSQLSQKYKPKYFLIRVPLFERDWKVPLKKEIGVDYRLDDTHYIEYTLETFADEIKRAGLQVDKLEVRWGEIWAIIK